MRGNPPLHLALALIGFFLLAIPLAKLTFARTDVRPVTPTIGTPVENITTSGCLLRVRFAHQPKGLSIIHGGKMLLETKGADAKSPIEQNIRLDISRDGIELKVAAEWPEGTPDTALTIELEPDGLDTRSVTRWSRGERINEIVSFTW